jgi:hypothetical protein
MANEKLKHGQKVVEWKLIAAHERFKQSFPVSSVGEIVTILV